MKTFSGTVATESIVRLGIFMALPKRIFDLVVGIGLLILFSPLLLLIAVLIKFDSKGPILFVQERLGQNGAVFRMFKFRTMVVNAEKMGTGLFSYSDDFRVTRIGKYLRITSLDEIPQILNIIEGSMSLVGPRPPVVYELGDYRDFTPHMKIRFRVKPGITGLAQVSGRNDLNWDQKIQYDNLYVERFQRRGIIEDIVILFRTLLVVFAMKNIIEKERPESK